MITTKCFVNIHHLAKLQNFFLVTRTFKFYSLRNFHLYNIVLLTIVTMLYNTSPELTYIGKLVLFDHLHLFPPPPTPDSGNHQFVVPEFVCLFVCFLLDSPYK